MRARLLALCCASNSPPRSRPPAPARAGRARQAAGRVKTSRSRVYLCSDSAAIFHFANAVFNNSLRTRAIDPPRTPRDQLESKQCVHSLRARLEQQKRCESGSVRAARRGGSILFLV